MDEQQRNRAAEEIAAAMERQSMSAATLAAAAGVSKNTMTSLLRGENVQQKTLRKVRDALGILPKVQTETVDADVETVALAVRTWLAGLPRQDRPEAVAALIQCVMVWAANGRTQPNG